MTDEIEKLSMDLATRTTGLAVTDQASANMAAELMLAGKSIVKKIKEKFAPLKDKARASWQGLVDWEKAELGKVEPFIDVLNGKLSNWRAGEERERREAAARRVEEERQRLVDEALRRARVAEEQAEYRRRQLEHESERLAQEATKKANDEAAMKHIEEEREKLRLQAEESRRIAEEETDKAIDEAAKAEAALAPAPVVAEPPKTSGLAMRKYWKARINDPVFDPIKANLRLLLRAVLDGQVSIEAVSPCMTYLNDLASRLKDQIKIPGVEFYVEERMAEIGKRNKP